MFANVGCRPASICRIAPPHATARASGGDTRLSMSAATIDATTRKNHAGDMSPYSPRHARDASAKTAPSTESMSHCPGETSRIQPGGIRSPSVVARASIRLTVRSRGGGHIRRGMYPGGP
ncbi:hypothetical protein GCM10027426_24370 [Microbacterium lacusdiani]